MGRSVSRRAGLLAAALLSVAGTARGAPPTRRVAVLEFTASWSAQCGAPSRPAEVAERCETLALLTDEARSGSLDVLRPPGYLVMTRENTAQILKEMGAGAGACTEGECEVETARLIGADVVISGQVSVLEGTWIASAKVHDVKSAALLGTAKARGRTKLELMDAVKREVEFMVRRALGPGAGAPSRPTARDGAFEDGASAVFDAGADEVLVGFESEPPGAVVQVDGLLLCKETPCRKRVVVGEHLANFQKERHAAANARFTAAKGGTVKATLAPLFGWLTVETAPSGIAVSIEGADAGRSPLVSREVDGGSVEVAVADRCYLRSGERVTVRAGERRTVRLAAKPRMAGLKVNAEDERGNAVEADVFVDGVVVGPAGAALKVPLCSRKLSVNLGGEAFEQELRLEEGKVARVVAAPGRRVVSAPGRKVVLVEKSDRDRDGVPDVEDRCPDLPGKPEFQGCPDTDGDGIRDAEDACPRQAGPKENQGCPVSRDTDGDGIPDDVDRCPENPEDKDGFQDEDGCPEPDNDGDGIIDRMDACPINPGPVANQGCPVIDRDGDGVPDDEDRCPDQPGKPELKGCRDSDGDGIPDGEDKCPTVPGKKEFGGCPDTDVDGIPDGEDKCPLNSGPKENGGCPDIDRDGDGIPDRLDKCPDKPGPPPDGCPRKARPPK